MDTTTTFPPEIGPVHVLCVILQLYVIYYKLFQFRSKDGVWNNSSASQSCGVWFNHRWWLVTSCPLRLKSLHSRKLIDHILGSGWCLPQANLFDLTLAGVPAEFNEFLPKDCDEYKKWKEAQSNQIEGQMQELRVGDGDGAAPAPEPTKTSSKKKKAAPHVSWVLVYLGWSFIVGRALECHWWSTSQSLIP